MGESGGGARQLWQSLVELLIGHEPVPRRPRRWWPPLIAGVLMLIIALALLSDVRQYYGVLRIGAPVLALVIALPVVMMVRWPLMAWRLCLVTMLVLIPFWNGPDKGMPAHAMHVVIYLATLVNVGLRVGPLRIGWAWVLTMVLIWAIVYPLNSDNAIGATVIVTLLSLASGAIGGLIQARRQLTVETQRGEAEQAQRTLLEERARIARELHDVVAHHMSLIAVQAETAPYRLSALEPATRDEFQAIGGAARQALSEMRRLLGVLRNESAPELAPQPGLGVLDDLLDQVRHAGTEVVCAQAGQPRPLAAAVDVSAYRVVQESLSNARRHAPGARVSVFVTYQEDAVRVEVSNDPPTAPPEDAPAGTGHGLLGMRERASMLGGTLSAAPTSSGGFQVVAVLPYERKT